MPKPTQEQHSQEDAILDEKRRQAAEVVSTWLTQKSLDDTLAPGASLSLGDMARAVEYGLINQAIYFIVTNKSDAPPVKNRKTRIDLPGPVINQGIELSHLFAVGLQIKEGTTLEALLSQGDASLALLYADHVNITIDKGRITPSTEGVVKIKDPTFGTFPTN